MNRIPSEDGVVSIILCVTLNRHKGVQDLNSMPNITHFTCAMPLSDTPMFKLMVLQSRTRKHRINKHCFV